MLDAYELLETVGKGAYGKIIKARRFDDGEVVVVKKVALDRLTPQEQNDTLNEVKLMQQLDHPNIVKFIDSGLENQTMIIVMEFLEGGDLSQQIKARQPTESLFDEDVLWRYCYDMAKGIKYLHDRRVLHRDIKASNMLVDIRSPGGRIKIADFGFGKLMGAQQLAYSGVGTPLYMSPELMFEKGYDEKADIWAFGCLLYELAALKPPFNATTHVALAKKIAGDTPVALPPKYSPEFCSMVFQMLHKDKDQRPDINQILTYPPLLSRVGSGGDGQIMGADGMMSPEESEVWKEITESLAQGASLASQLNRLVPKLAAARRDNAELRQRIGEVENDGQRTSQKAYEDLLAQRTAEIDARERKLVAEMESRERKLARDIDAFARATADIEAAARDSKARESALKKWEDELTLRETELVKRESEVAAAKAAAEAAKTTPEDGPKWEVRTPSPASQRNVTSRLSASDRSSSSSGSSSSDKENGCVPLSPFGVLHELSRDNLRAMEQQTAAVKDREKDKVGNIRKWVETSPAPPVPSITAAAMPMTPTTPKMPTYRTAWDHFSPSPRYKVPPPLPVSPVQQVAVATQQQQQCAVPIRTPAVEKVIVVKASVKPQPQQLQRIMDKVAGAPPVIPLATPDRPAVVHTPKLIQFPAEHFGICTLPSGSKIGGLFAWRRQQQETRISPGTACLDKRVVVAPVWGNKEHCSLTPPASHVVFLIRATENSASKLSIKAVHTRLVRDGVFHRVGLTTSDMKRLPWYTNPDTRTSWYSLDFKSRAEISQFVLEFDAPNLVEELVVGRAGKLLDLISEAHTCPAAVYQPVCTPAVPAYQPKSASPIVMSPRFLDIPTPSIADCGAPAPTAANMVPAKGAVFTTAAVTAQATVATPTTPMCARPQMSPMSFTNATEEFLRQARHLENKFAEFKNMV